MASRGEPGGEFLEGDERMRVKVESVRHGPHLFVSGGPVNSPAERAAFIRQSIHKYLRICAPEDLLLGRKGKSNHWVWITINEEPTEQYIVKAEVTLSLVLETFQSADGSFGPLKEED